MKSLKTALIASLLLVSSAFAAVSLTPQPTVVTFTPPGDLFIVDLMLSVDTSGDSSNGTNGLSVFLSSDAPGAIQLVNRQIHAPLITDPTKTDAALGIPTYTLPTVYDPAKDVGSTTSTSNLTAYYGVYERLTFRVVGSVLPIRIFIDSSWGNPDDFSNNDLPRASVFMPEPGSVILVLVSTLLFARRRPMK